MPGKQAKVVFWFVCSVVGKIDCCRNNICRTGDISEIHYDLGRLFANIQSNLMHVNILRAFFSAISQYFFAEAI